MLQYGYSHAVIGNEHSSNVGNLMWLAEGRNINHQCMYDAEQLINQSVQILVEEIHYYSILQPIHDVPIFSLLRQKVQAVTATHSCNVQPPKCCYVYVALVPSIPSARGH